MLDILCQPTEEVIAAIESLRPTLQPTEVPADPRYNSPEGVLFRKALAVIEDEDNWTCKSSGVDGDRKCGMYILDEADGCFDSQDRRPPSYQYYQIFGALSNVMGGNGIIYYNDTHTHAENVAKWHEAGRANGWL